MTSYIKKSDQNKPWAKRLEAKKREIKSIDIRSIFRIYCEGQNTEPNYFDSFPVNTETKIEEIIGLGRSKTSLVEKVIELLKDGNFLLGQSEYDENRQIWVVFDFDKRNDKGEDVDFNNAIKLAISNNINVAYSNDSFELWFILHFNYNDAILTRNEYYEILSEHFNINYEKHGKEKEFSKSIYNMLLQNQDQALKHAKKLHESYEDESYCTHMPCTTVYLLVQELNKCLKK
jgi:RloB-like protein